MTKFDLEVKFPDGTKKPQNYEFCDKDDQIVIGGFGLTKAGGKWYIGFDTSNPNLADVASEIVLPSEIRSGGIAIIPLKNITISSTGNIEFELESTTGRASGGVKKFTITPNSVKFKGKEIPVTKKGDVMDVQLPKNFMQLFMSNDPTCSIRGKLPQEFFQTIVANKANDPIKEAFTSGVAQHRTMNNADSSKSFDVLRVGDKNFTLLDGKMAEISNIFHIKQSDGKETIGCIFSDGKSTVARVLKDVESHEAEEFAKICLGSSFSPALWNDRSTYLYDSATLATKGLTQTEFKSRKTNVKNLTSDGRPLPPPMLIEQKSGHWFINGVDTGYEYQGATSTLPSINGSRKWEINGVDTGVLAQSSDGRTAVTPALDSSSGNLIIGSFDAGVNLDGEIPPIPYIDATSNTWIINGIDTGLDGASNIKIVNNEWREDDGSPNGIEIATLTNKSSIGKDGPQISIDPSSKNWMVDGVDTGEPAEVKELATKIEQDPFTKHWIIDGVDTGETYLGPNGKDAVLPIINSERKWEVNGVKTDKIGMTKDKKDHGMIPEIDVDGKWKIDDFVHSKGLDGEAGKPAPKPTFDPSTHHWLINGEDTGLDAFLTPLKIVNNEWRVNDGSPDGKEISALTNKSSVGEKGKDGVSPEIGANGNWFMEGTDTGKPAVVKEKEDKKEKDDSKPSPYSFPGAPLFRLAGVIIGVLGILSGLIGILALGVFLFAMPTITKGMVNDFRANAANKQKTNLINKTMQKQRTKALIKQRRRDLRRSHKQIKNFANGLTLSPDWQAATDPLFSNKTGHLTKEARKALKKLDYSKIPLHKIEHHEEQLQAVLDYVNKLEQKIAGGEITSDPTKIGEMNTLINNIKNEINNVQPNIATIKEVRNFVEATQKEANNPAYNLTAERLYAGLSAANVTHDMVENLDTDPNKITNINNTIEQCYTNNYVPSMKNLLESGGTLDTLVSTLDSKLDAVGKSSARMDMTPCFHA